MKILLCAFACSPQWGSEPGVGWRWAHELAREHDVVVLVHERFREHIQAVPELPPRLSFVYYIAPWLGAWHDELLNKAWYYAWWLLCSTPTAARLQREHRFDLIHHLTLTSFRYPSLHGMLGVPFVMGPLAGGERAPLALRRSMSSSDRRHEFLRDLLLFSGRWDPSLWLSFATTRLVFCKTQDTIDALPRWVRAKACIQSEVGAPPAALEHAKSLPSTTSSLRVLTVGRLIGLKGIHLAVCAAAVLRDRGVDFRLDIIGKGPMRDDLERLIDDLELDARVGLHEFMPQLELFDRYLDADCFLFPSLHDSGGSVVLEAMSRGLPVVCLDLGGPKHAVDAYCARVIPTRGLDEVALVGKMADALQWMAEHRDERLRMSQAALDRAASLSWASVVATAYGRVHQALGHADAGA